MPTSTPSALVAPEKHEHIPGRHEHSWRYSPVHYTAICCLIWFVFFVQPHSWRVALWSHVRPLISDERTFLFVAAISVHLFMTVFGNLVMAFVYYIEHPFFEQFKIQSNKPWPWHRSPEERAQYFALIKKSIALIAFNQLVLQPLLIWFSYDGQKQRGMNGDIDKVPHWYVSLFHIAICMVVEDTLFYWAHRTLHWPRIYPYVHKVHHQYRTSIGIASEYAHPIEFIFSNAIPFAVGPLICGMHFYSYFMWSILRIAETIDGHSGYEFPWSPYRLLPFSGSSTAHDFHHSHNVGNFASFFTWWDRICGTDVAFKKWELQQEEKQLKQQQTGGNASNDNSIAQSPSPSLSPDADPSQSESDSDKAPVEKKPAVRATRSRSKKAE